ncbi:hypothetical protein [Nocardia cyriacigeorgica]|uniref:hypothetical protein n=1 Tax=Nocardia cyriacigeorgica TaxID=135487 RepID=UPI001893E5B4|nr:hypothetical protein [Nocardia cyriacigeorgica]MBF6416931.1 hypothetical protein [Nocardia cyriacigeorgica]
MPSDRDTLADLIAPHLDSYYGIYDGCDAAIAAGWRPPSRVIETAEELEALPIGAAVLDAFAAVCTRVHTDPVIGWVRATSAVGGGQHRHRPYLPATVLWEPEQEAQ